MHTPHDLSARFRRSCGESDRHQSDQSEIAPRSRLRGLRDPNRAADEDERAAVWCGSPRGAFGRGVSPCVGAGRDVSDGAVRRQRRQWRAASEAETPEERNCVHGVSQGASPPRGTGPMARCEAARDAGHRRRLAFVCAFLAGRAPSRVLNVNEFVLAGEGTLRLELAVLTVRADGSRVHSVSSSVDLHSMCQVQAQVRSGAALFAVRISWSS